MAVTIDPSLLIDDILRVLPETTDIAVAIGNSPLERFWMTEIRRSFQRFETRVTFHWLNKLPAEEMVKRVIALPPRSAIYYATVRIDANGEPQEEDRVLARLIKAGRSPVFTYMDSEFGRGIVGGPMMSTQDIAQQSAAARRAYPQRRNSGSVKTPVLGSSTPKYDWRELQRWKISEAAACARQHRAVPPADNLAKLSLADPASDSRDPGPGRHDHGAAL